MVDNIKEKIEDRIIDLINFGAGGRLIIFKPEDLGSDLVVEKRGDYKKNPISLKIYDIKDFDPASAKGFSEAKQDNFYLVFAHFDIVKQDLEDEIIIVSPIDQKKFSISKKDIGKFFMEKLL